VERVGVGQRHGARVVQSRVDGARHVLRHPVLHQVLGKVVFALLLPDQLRLADFARRSVHPRPSAVGDRLRLDPPRQPEMIRVDVRKEDALNLSRLDPERCPSGLPRCPSLRGVDACVEDRPAAFIAQQVAVDDPQRERQRDRHLVDVVSDRDERGVHWVLPSQRLHTFLI
jgi:hypothetical protein